MSDIQLDDLETFDIYLGDGLYAKYDGWHIILAAARGSQVHWVSLEPENLERLGWRVSYQKGIEAMLADKRDRDDN